jgi:predicted nucleotidyltransferase
MMPASMMEGHRRHQEIAKTEAIELCYDETMNLQAPAHVTHLLDEIVDSMKRLLGTNLVGMYLHGSLAMGSFNPDLSDIDFLVVTETKLSLETRRSLANTLMELTAHAPAKGLEMSVLTVDALRNFKYPTPYEFHSSIVWLERYQKGEVDFTDNDKVDADLAAHLTVTKARGVTLYGEPLETVFPDIPPRHYTESILEDARSILEDMNSEPVYNVLNLCRVRAFLEDGKIASKKEGGEWALSHATPFQKGIIEQALAEYSGGGTAPWDKAALNRFGQEMAEPLPL